MHSCTSGVQHAPTHAGFPLQLYRLASDPNLVETYGCAEFGQTQSDIAAHALDLGLGLRVVLNALSDDK